MNIPFSILLVVLSLFAPVLSWATPPWVAVGGDAADITPTRQEIDSRAVFLGGYGTGGRVPTHVIDAPQARVTVLSWKESEIVSIVLDASGVSNRLIARIQDAVFARIGVKQSRVWVSATHTHAGLDLQGIWGGVSEAYRARIIAEIARSAEKAWNSRELARLEVMQVPTAGLTGNRRGWRPLSHEAVVLRAVGLEGANAGKPVVTWISFAAHPTIMSAKNTGISRDFCGALVDEMEKAWGGMVSYINGAQGDVVVNQSGMPQGERERVLLFGERVSQRILKAEQSTGFSPIAFKEGRPAVRIKDVIWDQTVTNKIFYGAWQLGKLDYKAEVNLLDLEIKTRAGAFVVGDALTVVTAPGEPTERLAQQIRAQISTPFKAIWGLTGDTLGYFIPQDEFGSGRNNYYEETLSPSGTAGRDWVHRMGALLAR